MDKRNFLNTLYREPQGRLELRALGAGQTWQEFAPLDAFTQIHSFCFNATLQKKNVYFGVATRDGKGGKKENLVSIPAVWSDIDFKDTPKEAALKALQEFPFKASAIVSSGGGVHCYWCLKETLSPVDDPKAIERVENVNRRIVANLGGDLASIDATRILRMPDTENFKYTPSRLVKINYLSDFRYELEAFEDTLPEVAPPPATTSNGSKSEYTTENMALLMKCEFVKWCSEKPSEVIEPLWHALISNLASVRPGGVSLCHNLSKGHPEYSPKETNEKILHALEESRPISCAKIRERGFACKKSCGVTSPAGLLFSFENGVIEDVERIKLQLG